MIAILLTTYNSHHYIRELLDSLLRQTCKEWQLEVRDDGSTDDTMNIIQDYAQRDARIHVRHDSKKRGAKDGFLWLLENTEAEYFMFCDHDDVWLEDKIECTWSAMREGEKENPCKPCLVHTDLCVVDQDLQELHPSYWAFCHFREKQFSSKYFHLFYNNVTGCTMMLNKKAKDVSLPYPQETQMHDSWVTAAVLWRGGTIVNVAKPTILYRQHGDNTIGANEVPKFSAQMKSSSSLIKKTHHQYLAAKHLTRIPEFVFFIMKIYYMIQIHWNVRKK